MSAAPIETQLGEAAARLGARVLAEMYANPFWAERFGDRGRTHARKDGDYHVKYLVEALRANDDRVFVEYARWLRDVLVSRGMCSRHLAENFERLAVAIEEEPWPDRARAASVLRAGVRALVHREGDAGRIDPRRDEFARAAAAALHAAHPDWLARWGAAGRDRCADDLDYHLSYLTDALAFGHVHRFTAYVTFITEFLGRRAIPAAHVTASLDALDRALAAVSSLTAAPARFLAAGRDAVAAVEAS